MIQRGELVGISSYMELNETSWPWKMLKWIGRTGTTVLFEPVRWLGTQFYSSLVPVEEDMTSSTLELCSDAGYIHSGSYVHVPVLKVNGIPLEREACGAVFICCLRNFVEDW